MMNLTDPTIETSTVPYPCHGATQEEIDLYDDLVYWLDGIGQIIIGCTGIIGNCMAVPILISRKLNSIFNRILVFLAIFDNIFIFCAVLEGIRKNIGPFGDWHVYAFAYFGYQLQSISILSSIFMTVVLALERYLAITKPIEYHNAIQGANPWKRVWMYIIPVLILSTVFNLPKFAETKVVEEIIIKKRVDPETFETEFYNYTLVTVHPTDLRMNDAYIFWYNNLAKLLITGLIPFLSLCIFNTRIYGALRRRRNVMGPNATAAHQQQLNEDNRQALVLFSIVIIFLISNVPRIALNLHEVFTIEQYKEDVSHGCIHLPFWVLLSGTVSQLLMVVNSSINFFIYCVMSALFREVFWDYVTARCPQINCKKTPRAENGGGDGCGSGQAAAVSRASVELHETKVITISSENNWRNGAKTPRDGVV